MRSMSVFFKDLKATFKKPKVFIPIIVVLFIPVIYSGMFLTAFWDPYSKMNELPVAIVNQDNGAEYNGKSLQVGKDLVDELKKSDDFSWRFVSREEAEDGMKNKEYYMTIVIPEDFSTKATTLMDENPEPAQLIYEPNEGYNFLAAQIGGSAVKEIKSKVAAKVTEAYTETLFDKVEEISGGLGDAGSGANTLKDGAVKLDDGALTLKENLAKLVEGTDKLESGITPLQNGAGTLSKGAQDLQNGTSTLASGLSQLSAAGQKLEEGALKAGAGGKQLQAGLQSSLEGANTLSAGLKASGEGSTKLVAGLEASVEGTSKVTEGAKAVAQGLEQLTKASPELAANPAVQKLLAASQGVAAGSEQVLQGQQQLLLGSKELNGAQQQLLQGSQKLADGQDQLVKGATQVSLGQEQLASGLKQFNGKLSEAASGGKKLAEGSGKLSSGAQQIQNGMNQLSGGVVTIASGSKKLDNGAGELKDGMDKLTEGSGELATKLNEAADKTSSVKKTDALVNMYAQPIQIEEHKIDKVPNYGTGFSPYFLSLGLFIGALISTLVVPMRGSSVGDATGWNRFVSRVLGFSLMSLVQSILAALLVLYVLGLEVQSVPLFYLFTFVTSLCYMFITQALVTWLENPGRFIAILMLIFQLTTSAGTFPLELIPNWMKVFNPWLPMTYSVSGYKAVISSGQFGVAWGHMGILMVFGLIFLSFTLIYFLRHDRNEEVANEAILTA